MNNHAKRLVRTLEALGFERDYDAPTKGMAYRHPNQPDQVLKVFDAMTDTTITSVVRKANKIADTGWGGPREPETIRQRMEITRRRENEAQRRDREAALTRAERAEAEHDARQRLIQERRRVAELRDLMTPRHGR